MSTRSSSGIKFATALSTDDSHDDMTTPTPSPFVHENLDEFDMARKVAHTPQNSQVTIDSTQATCDSVISPRDRERRKGVKITTRKQSDSGAESPPSPLSMANSDITDNIPPYPSMSRSRTNVSNSNSNSDNSISYLYANAANEKRERIDQYKEKLSKLNNLLSPMQLFHDIDLMIRNYQKLRKEYCLQWELQQIYRQQIRSLLKQSLVNTSWYSPYILCMYLFVHSFCYFILSALYYLYHHQKLYRVYF